jgi:hypothetical protein
MSHDRVESMAATPGASKAPLRASVEQDGHGGVLLRSPRILRASKSSIGEWKPLEMENEVV